MGDGVVGEGQGEAFELVAQLGGEALLELVDRRLVDLLQPVAAGVVERCGAHFLEELFDHRADAHDLGRLLHHVGHRLRAVPVRVRGGVGASGLLAASATGMAMG